MDLTLDIKLLYNSEMNFQERKIKRGKENFSRDQFGPGIAGEKAYRIISSGAECEAILSPNKKCGKRGIMTLDFDVLGELEQLVSCGDEHMELMKEIVDRDLGERKTVFGINGWGRA